MTPEQLRRVAAAADLHRERFGDRTADEVLREGRTMRALITGDRGFLGRHFTAELKARGWQVTGLDTKVTSALDCRSYFQAYLRAGGGMRTEEWDLVVHCAAVVGGRETIERDPLATAESLSIDAEMFRWAAVARPGRVLYFSSSAAYPTALQNPRPGDVVVPLAEDDLEIGAPLMPDEVYGWSKVTGEILADRLRQAGVPVTVVRPFSGYGEDQDESYPFRAILERVRRREAPLEVWSDAVRDFIHVDDVVRGALAVAASGTEEPVNLCTGRPTAFSALARLMADTAGYEPDIRVLKNMPAGVGFRVGDPTRMIQYYTPQVSLEQGVIRALAAD